VTPSKPVGGPSHVAARNLDSMRNSKANMTKHIRFISHSHLICISSFGIRVYPSTCGGPSVRSLQTPRPCTRRKEHYAHPSRLRMVFQVPTPTTICSALHASSRDVSCGRGDRLVVSLRQKNSKSPMCLATAADGFMRRRGGCALPMMRCARCGTPRADSADAGSNRCRNASGGAVLWAAGIASGSDATLAGIFFPMPPWGGQGAGPVCDGVMPM